MSSANYTPAKYRDLFLQSLPLIDVRAPVEFEQGTLPGAVNLPILNDAERALVGTTYKMKGQDAAVALGLQLISSEVKEQRVELWNQYIQAHPQAVLFCYRGGKRSQFTQKWLRERGVERPLIEGGYKAIRNFLLGEIDRFSAAYSLDVVSGPTGSGKTLLLKSLEKTHPVLDLEGLARHRGSAFGAREIAQPSQANFENSAAVAMLRLEDRISERLVPIVEDESRLIGKCYLPTSLFERMRNSEVIWVDEKLEKRVENIFADYILQTSIGLASSNSPRCAEESDILRQQAIDLFKHYRSATLAIQRKLGGLRTQEVIEAIETSESDFINRNSLDSNRQWIGLLLQYYYDPLYLGSLERRQVKVKFKGSFAECQSYFLSRAALSV